MDIKAKALDYLKNMQPKLCVLSTSVQDKPESAVMSYIVLDDLSIIISTHSTTRKWKNITRNKNVALVFGWNFIQLNIQYEGVATQVKKGTDYTWHEEKYLLEHPELKKYKGPDTVFMRIKPSWIRVADFSIYPPYIEEETYS